MRPRTLDEYCGQGHLLGSGKPLRVALDQGNIHSMILWGPPGVGKTTLARLFALHVDAHFIIFSAVLSGVKEIRVAIDQALQVKAESGRKTILFIDEVHRFNTSQQDTFLPYIENGTFTFVGATTENPSFELNNALLSQARVYLLRSLSSDDIQQLLQRAVRDVGRGLALQPIELDPKVLKQLAVAADGDGRRGLNLLELAADQAEEDEGVYRVAETVILDVLQSSVRRYDKQGDLYYDFISAFHKSVRGSSPDGALYWYCRMLDGGCDPLYIARRLVAIASEDIGNADPRAMQIVNSAWRIFETVGRAEGRLAIAQAALYCASAPKSYAVYQAFNQAVADVREDPDYEVPEHLRNAPASLMSDLGYGTDYRYAHNEPNGYAEGECYLPEQIMAREYYQPVPRGLEIKISGKMKYLGELDRYSRNQRYKKG